MYRKHCGLVCGVSFSHAMKYYAIILIDISKQQLILDVLGSWRLRPLANRLCVQQLVQANIKEIKGPEIRKAFMSRRHHDQPIMTLDTERFHDDVIKWKHFPRYWPFVRGIHRSPVNPPHKGQWRGALMSTLICVRINGWVNNREAGDFRRHLAHYDVIVM